MLAKRYGVNLKTIAMWRMSASYPRTGPNETRSAVLIIEVKRRWLWSPSDGYLAASRRLFVHPCSPGALHLHTAGVPTTQGYRIRPLNQDCDSATMRAIRPPTSDDPVRRLRAMRTASREHAKSQ